MLSEILNKNNKIIIRTQLTIISCIYKIPNYESQPFLLN